MIKGRIGPRIGVRIGPAIGLGADPLAADVMVQQSPLSSVDEAMASNIGQSILGNTDDLISVRRLQTAKDAAGGIKVPASASEWQALGYGTPQNLYLAQEASGNLVDTMAHTDLVVNGAPTFQNAIAGWTRKGVSFTETVGQGFYVASTNSPHPETDSTAYLIYVLFSSNSTTRMVLQIAGLNLDLQINTIGTLRFFVQGSANIDGAYNYRDGAVHPIIVRYNWATQTAKVITDKEILTSTFRTAGVTAGSHGIGGTTTTPPVCTIAYAVTWYGQDAETIGADTLTALNWTLAYNPNTDTGTSFGTQLLDTVDGTRPVKLLAPAGNQYNRPKGPYPLVVVLHAYSGTASSQLITFGLVGLKDLDSGYFVILPNGKVDSATKQFWNANAAGCDLDHTGINDKAYLQSLIRQAVANAGPNLDRSRVYVIGESNGAAMAVEVALATSDVVTGCFAAASFISTTETPSIALPVNFIIQDQTGDPTVLYAGNSTTTPNPFTGFYKPKLTEVDNLATANGTAGGSLQAAYDQVDLITDIGGNETDRRAYSGMPPNGAVEHWVNSAAVHIPAWTNFRTLVLGWLNSHPRV